MRIFRLSTSGLSIAMAMALAVWEVYFFWFGGRGALGPLDGSIGLFGPARVGMNLAWLVAIYLSFQLISIPFAVSNSQSRFLSVFDSMASLVPLAVTLIVLFGRSQLLGTGGRWEAAILLFFVNCVDLFGGFIFTIALSRRTMDYIGAQGPRG